MAPASSEAGAVVSTATAARKPKAACNSKSMTEHNLTRILSEHCFNLKVSEIEYRVVVTYTLGKVSTHLDADQHRQVTALILKHLPTHKLTQVQHQGHQLANAVPGQNRCTAARREDDVFCQTSTAGAGSQ